MQSQLPTLSASQQITESTEELSLTSPKNPTSPNPSTYLFDPTGLLGDKYFSGAPDDVCEYLTKYFAPLHTQLTAEMAKQFKRPDIPVMRVQKLDDMFQRKGHSFMKARDYTFKEIHKGLLHAVGPIAELLAKLTNDQQVEPNKLIQYISATLILMGSSVARILTARRKNAIRELNPSLTTEVPNLPRDNDTNLLFGPENFKRLTETQRDKAQMDRLIERPPKRPKLTTSAPSFKPTNSKPDKFFRKGPAGGPGFRGADSRKPRPYHGKPFRLNYFGPNRHSN